MSPFLLTLLLCIRCLCWCRILTRVGRIKAKKVRIGRIKGFIGVRVGCKGKIED